MEKWKNMPPTSKTVKDAALTEQFFGQVSESIQMLFELTSRIDERVKMLIERQKELDAQIEKLLELQHSALTRLSAVESKDFNRVQENLHSLSEKVAVIVSDDPQKELIELRSKVQNLEVKAENIQMRIGYHDHRWTQIFDAVWKVALMCIAGYILYKLGLQAPPN